MLRQTDRVTLRAEKCNPCLRDFLLPTLGTDKTDGPRFWDSHHSRVDNFEAEKALEIHQPGLSFQISSLLQRKFTRFT